MNETIYLALLIAALVVAIVGEAEANFRSLIGYAVIILCVALLYQRLA